MALSAVVAGAAVGASLLDSLLQNSANSKNYKIQQEILAWQKEMQGETWRREDNAIKRRVADLKASGLSPVLAAGQGAQSSSPIQVTAPIKEPNQIGSGLVKGLNNAMMAQELMASNASIAHTRAQEALTNQQLENAKLDGLAKKHDLAIASKDGLPMQPSGTGKMVRDILSGIDKIKAGYQQGNTDFVKKGIKSVNSVEQDKIDQAKKQAKEWRSKSAKKSHENYYRKYVENQKNSQYYLDKINDLKRRSR